MKRSRITRGGALGALATAVLSTLPAQASAGDVVVRVGGIAASTGEIGCALFPAGTAFPMDASGARQIWLKADTAGVICRFDGVAEGSWAVSVSHDLNGNRRVDTNVFGIPIEAWGVSNNVRPSLRAPGFDEAAFKVATSAVELDIRVAK